MKTTKKYQNYIERNTYPLDVFENPQTECCQLSYFLVPFHDLLPVTSIFRIL